MTTLCAYGRPTESLAYDAGVRVAGQMLGRGQPGLGIRAETRRSGDAPSQACAQRGGTASGCSHGPAGCLDVSSRLGLSVAWSAWAWSRADGPPLRRAQDL